MRALLSLVFCWLCISVEGGKKQEGTPALLLELATILAGEYQNSVPTDDSSGLPLTGETFNFLYVPVVVDALSPAVTIYFERRRLAGHKFELQGQQIFALTLETPTKIRQAIYEIENPERFSADPKRLKKLEGLELSELTNRPECDVFWEQIEDETFVSTLSTDRCVIEVGGQQFLPAGNRTLTCSSLTIRDAVRDVSTGEIVGGTLTPAVLEEISNPFPVPVRVFKRNKCFEVPCTGKKPRRKNQPVWADIRKSRHFELKRRPIYKIYKKY